MKFECKCVAKKVKINAIDELEQNICLINCYPNPFISNIDVPQDIISTELIIYDVNGKMVKRVNVNNSQKGCQNIDLSNVSEGVYSCVLFSDGKIKSQNKIVKIK